MSVKENKREYLAWWDILILTIIMFGEAICSSTVSFFALSAENKGENAVEFSASEHWSIIFAELVILLVVFLYLKLRHFDFSQWKVRITPKTAAYGVVLFLVVALVMDLFMLVTAALQGDSRSISYGMGLIEFLLGVNIPTVLAAIINGFFEELYFLGICLAVPKKFRKGAFLFSVLIRFSFHTYQGIFPALGIGLVLGIIYYIIYEKSSEKNLFPFFLSHMIADVVGLGILGYILPY